MQAQESFEERRLPAAAGEMRRMSWMGRIGKGVAVLLRERLSLARKNRSEMPLRVLETVSLGGRRQVFLLACGGERYLVGAGAETVGCMLRIADLGGTDLQITDREPGEDDGVDGVYGQDQERGRADGAGSR
jgi:Flagellar biosynthesis protein, FliO